MAAVSKSYGVGDTVYVFYKNSPTYGTLPQSRVVKNVNVSDASSTAIVEFTNGDPVTDGASSAQRVFTTQALCAKKIIDDVISDYAACALLDTGSTSGASTSGQAVTGLIRKS